MYSACMVAIQIRDVPEDVRSALAAQAEAYGQSLQGYLLDVISTQARRTANLTALQRFVHRNDGIRSTAGDTVAELTAVRAEAAGG